MAERTTVRLPEDLLHLARRKAASERRTLTSLLEEGLRLVVSEKRKAANATRVLPPVSSAAGGLMPGVDLTKPSAFEEPEDLERLGATKRVKRPR